MTTISNVRPLPVKVAARAAAAPTSTAKPTAAAPAAKPAAAPSHAIAEGVGLAAGAGYFAVVFRMLGALNPGAAIIAVPGLIVGALAGARIGKWVAEGFKAHVNTGAAVGGTVLGAVYAYGGMGLLVGAAESGGIANALAIMAPGVLLAIIAGGALGGLLQNHFSKKK